MTRCYRDAYFLIPIHSYRGWVVLIFMKFPSIAPINTVHNNQRDGHMRQMINKGKVSYQPNSLGGGSPLQAKAVEGGFTSYAERIDAKKVRARSKSFFDHFSQARLFYMSQSDAEKNHIVNALSFELGNCDTEAIRVRVSRNAYPNRWNPCCPRGR